MFLQRISIEGGGVGMNAFDRIPVFGYTIERLLFINGLNKIKDFQKYNFINICFFDLKYDVETFHQDNYLKILFVREKIDVEYFLNLRGYEQLKYIAEHVYIALKKVFVRDNLPMDVLDKAYSELVNEDYFLLMSKLWVKGQHIIIKERYEYDRKVYKLEVVKKKQVIFNEILFKEDPLKRTNHISELGGKQRAYPDTGQFIEPNIFRINVAHKEYNFNIDTFQIEVVEHDELREEYFDWECIHDGEKVIQAKND